MTARNLASSVRPNQHLKILLSASHRPMLISSGIENKFLPADLPRSIINLARERFSLISGSLGNYRLESFPESPPVIFRLFRPLNCERILRRADFSRLPLASLRLSPSSYLNSYADLLFLTADFSAANRIHHSIALNRDFPAASDALFHLITPLFSFGRTREGSRARLYSLLIELKVCQSEVPNLTSTHF